MENTKRAEENVKDQGKEISFQWFFVNFLVYWKWFAISIILFLACGYVYLRYVTPVYNVNSMIVFRGGSRGVDSESSYFQRLGYIESGTNIENEMEVLHSRDLLETAVVEGDYYIRYSVKGRFKNTEIYDGAGRQYYSAVPVKVFCDKNIISALFSTLSLKISLSDNSTILVDGQYGNNNFSYKLSTIPAVIKTPIGELLLLSDENVVLKKEYPLYVTITPPLWVAQSYIGAIATDYVAKKATVVSVTLNETNGKRGEDFLNRLFEVYNRETSADKNKAGEKASDFIKARLEDLTKELSSSEDEIEAYKKENRIALDLSPDQGMTTGEMNNNYKKLVGVGSDEIRLSYLRDAVEKNTDNSALLPAISTDGDGGDLSAKIGTYNQSVLEKNRLLAYTKDDAPTIKKRNERLELLRQDILFTLKTAEYSISTTKKEYEGLYDNYLSGLGDVPRKDRELADLQRLQGSKSDLYSSLLRQKQQIEYSLAVSTPSLKVLNVPLTSGLIYPRRTLTYLICLVLGLVLPFIIVGIRELFNFKLTKEEEVRRFSNIPVIISLPIAKTKSPIVISSHTTTAIVERFRLLRTNLQFILDNPEKKSVLITSTISGEGKTFVAMNLALTFSLKYKTILVGLDIRRPKINNYLNLPKQMGVISYLTGEETNINNLICRNVNGTNLDVLTSGMIPLNPNELLIEHTLDTMFQELRQQYDYIIIDSSPVGSVSDAFLLNRVCDVSLFVVRNNLTPKSAISLANKIYEEKRLNNINLVLNGFAGGKNRYGYGYGGYGYGYGYGYGGYGYGYESES